MRILVTGASGYVAKWVIEDLARSHDLVLSSRRHPSEGPNATQIGSPFIRADLTRLDDCRLAVEGVDAIAHLGGSNEPSPDTFRINTLGTHYLMEAAREADVRRIVMASSNCLLGHCFSITGRAFPVKYFPFDEAHPSHIEDNYGLSKLVTEITLETYTRAYGIDCIALRLNWCWGPREMTWRKSQEFRLADHATGFWAYVDMRDVAQAFRLALESPLSSSSNFGAYFISAADTMADEPSVELIERFYPQYSPLAEKLQGRETFFNWQAAHQALGYTPKHSWKD